MRPLIVALALILSATAAFPANTPAESFVGDWEGTLDIGTPLRVVIHLVNTDGKWSGTTDSPDQGSYGVVLSEVSIKGNDLYWAVDAIDGEYRGTLSKDSKQIDGTLTQSGHPMPLTFARAAGSTSTPAAKASAPIPSTAAATPAQPFAGDWSGALEAGVRLRIIVHLANTGGAWSGTMESPDQGAGEIPFSTVTVDGAMLHLEVASIGGSYEGTLGADGKMITGTWTQSGMGLPLNLARGTESAPGPNRPQEPKPPFPYRSEDVAVTGPGGITLAGTFTAPNGNGPFPTVLLITGSGAQDRNEELLGHKPFLVLSDYLTRQGIAVLRLDDRGFGKSTGNSATATTEDFAQDAMSAVAYLKTRKDVDAKKIGLVGHSEGGVIAPIVASRSKDVAYIVMMAGVGVSPQDLLVKQASDIMRANGLPDVAIQYNAAAQRRTFQIATSSADSTVMRQQLDAVGDSLITQLSALDPSRKEMVTQQVRGGMAMTMTPWYRYFLTLKPEEALRKVKQPVLAVNGSLDLQVSSKDNLPAIEKALKAGGNKDVTVVELPSLNHLFQTAKTGSPMEYATIEETMSPVALKTIGDWIAARTAPKKK